MTAIPKKLLFTVHDYYKMLEFGILSEDDRVELINGEIIKMAAIGSKHAAYVKRIREMLGEILEKAVIISVQDPIHLDDLSEPEPDIAILKRRTDFYEQAHPEAADVLLLVEVADSSFAFDKKVKVPLYAKAGIPEVWLVDLQALELWVFHTPHKGKYQFSQAFATGDSIDIPVAGKPALDLNLLFQ